jgi:UDP-glucose 4-epimerase
MTALAVGSVGFVGSCIVRRQAVNGNEPDIIGIFSSGSVEKGTNSEG